MNLADIQRQMNGVTTTSQTLSTVETIMSDFKVVANTDTYIEVLWFNESTLCVEQHRVKKASPLIALTDNAILTAIIQGRSIQVG